MNVNIYDFLMGVIVSISLLFFVLFYHIKLYKNHVFLKVWLLATGLVIIGFIISLFSSNSNLSMIAIMISNLLLIASQVVYYFSLKSFFENNKYVLLTSKVDFIIKTASEGTMILDGKATSNKNNYLKNPAQLYFYAMVYKFK